MLPLEFDVTLFYGTVGTYQCCGSGYGPFSPDTYVSNPGYEKFYKKFKKKVQKIELFQFFRKILQFFQVKMKKVDNIYE